MNFRPLVYSASLAALAGSCLAADSTHELRDSLLARGDFNGNGLPDLAVVERATGIVRIAHSGGSGMLHWTESHHTGIAPATGVASGLFLHGVRNSLAVTGTWANRTNVFDVSGAVPGVPVSVFGAFTGPTGVAAAQAAGGSALEELIVCYTENGAVPQERAFFRFTGSPAAPQAYLPSNPAPAVPMLEMRPRRLQGLSPAAIGSFTGALPSESFRILRVGATPITVIASLDGLPSGSHFAHADFDGAATTSPTQFVFFKRGDPLLRWTSLSAANVFSGIATFNANSPVEHVTAIPAAAGGWALLVAFADGWAQMFSFNGQSAPVPGELFPSLGPNDLYQAAFATGAGDFHLLAGPAGRPFARAHRFTWNGSHHAPNGVSELPEIRVGNPTANLFAFSKDPFIATDAVLLGAYSAGEWTRAGTHGGGNIQAQQARFAGSADGITNFQAVNLGPAPVGTAHVMTNEIPSGQPGVASYASAYGPTRALGRTIGEVTIDPAPGRMLRSINPRFHAPPGVAVFWRIGGGQWINTVSQNPGWQFDAFTIQWFGISGGVTTPVHAASYTFAEPPDTLDSDGDGIPDYVKIHLGLDPVGSGGDSDFDGASDLLEILTGTDPNDNSDVPTRVGGPVVGLPQFDGNYQNTFTFRLTPVAIAGSERYETLGAEGAGVAIHDLPGLQLGREITAGAGPQAAVIRGVQAAFAGSVLVAGTDANFDLTAPAPNKRRGRELVGLLLVPKSQLGPVPHVYSGGPLAAEAAAWIEAARDHFSQPQPEIPHTLDADTTLTLLLVELKLEEILRSRGELGPDQGLTLTSFRPSESALPLSSRHDAPADAAFRFTPAEMDALRRYGTVTGFEYPAGWRTADIHDVIAAAIADPPDAATGHLVNLAREIYFLCAAADDATLPQFPSPVDTLRRFLRTGLLPGDENEDGILDPEEVLSYWRHVTLGPAVIRQAHEVVDRLLALPSNRPTASGIFVVDAETFAGPVPVVRGLTTLAPHVLLQGNGEPWPLALFARLVTGAELTVTGFTDVESPHAPHALEVITLSLTKLPSSGVQDSNNNLLSDAWEDLFPGVAEDGPFGDTDGDGVSNLQEYLDGTDPTDPSSYSGQPVSLLPPVLVIAQGGAAGIFHITFEFPAEYADKIVFHLQQSDDLATGFTDTGILAPKVAEGVFSITLDTGLIGANFWRIRLGLK